MSVSCSILIVEDNEDHRMLIQRALAKERERFPIVEFANDATEARAYVKQMEFDCFLVDNQLPTESGLEFITTLQGQGVAGSFVLMTSAGTEELVVQAYRNNVDQYLTKDVGFWQDLPSILIQIIETTAMERANESRVEELERVNQGLDEVNTEVQVQFDELKKRRNATRELLANAVEELADVIDDTQDKGVKKALKKIHRTLLQAATTSR